MERGCVDCGYKGHPEALDFDHIGTDKKFIISRVKTCSMEHLLAEMDKCEVVCANSTGYAATIGDRESEHLGQGG